MGRSWLTAQMQTSPVRTDTAMKLKFDQANPAYVTRAGERLPSQRARVFYAAVVLFISGMPAAQAQDAKSPYPSMAPLDQYLMSDRRAEIALARSSAPEALSKDATVLVLGKNGYEAAFEGKNGFTCLVERSWMSPFDSPDFWNPKIRGPVCYNPAAVRSILPYTLTSSRSAKTCFGAASAQAKLPRSAPQTMGPPLLDAQLLRRKLRRSQPHHRQALHTGSAHAFQPAALVPA
jgi:hypothetical protein